MISILTPTHNPKYLYECFESILAQTFTDWEWVIGVNHFTPEMQIPNEIIQHPKVRIIQMECSNRIGDIKNQLFNQGKGDILLELDHDDILLPDCLEEVFKAFKNPNIGFVYSDNAKLGKFTPYNAKFGWTYKIINFAKYGELISMDSQPLTAGRLGYIWFAPDHVRAWRTSIYKQIGGHNPALEILDDLDLMHRTYMITEFHHIPKCLYIYRITGENTWLERNQAIQKKTIEIYNLNIEQLAKRYSQLHHLLNIDLCGGFGKPNGYISIDKCNGDIIADLEHGIPLADNSCGLIRASDALEHVKDQQFLMKEIHRVLAPGGILLSKTPSTDGRGAWQDPTHISFWNQNSFWYWTRPEQMQYIHNTNIRFRECRLETIFPTAYHKENNISYAIADLEALK